MSKNYVSPTGSPIIGTLERVPGVAGISGINDDGTPNHDGETDLDWDGQETVQKDGKDIFVDEDGGEWTFDQLKPEDEGDDEGDNACDEAGRSFLVTVDYQDDDGAEKSARVIVAADDEDGARDIACQNVKARPNVMKIVGGTVEAAPDVVEA